MGLVAIVFLALFAYFLYAQTRKPSRFPPGPPRIPIIGSLPFLLGRGRPNGPKTFLHGTIENAKVYGSIFGFWLGKVPTVVLTDYDQIKELLKSYDSAARPDLRPFPAVRPGWGTLKGTENEVNAPGVILTHGKFWQEQRRFLLKNLRDFGFGKKSMQDLALYNVEDLVAHLKQINRKPVPLRKTFQISIVNALMMILVGKRMPLDDPESMKASKALVEAVDASAQFLLPIANFLPHPSLVLLPGIKHLSGHAQMEKAFKTFNELLKVSLDEHLATFDPENIRDFLDLYMAEVYKTTDPSSSFFKERGHAFAWNILIELFFAGADTTASSLHWTFLYLLHHPHVKQRIQQELDDTCTSDRLPTLDDRANLPYTMAVLHESLRLSALTPFSVPHMANKDIAIGDFCIPKGATILPSLVSVMRDSTYFKDADDFMPERFLTLDGKFKSCERVIPFSIGKRACLGQVLAEQEYFLFFAGLMKNFDIHLAPMEKLPSYDLRDHTVDQGLRPPPDMKVIFSQR